MKWNVEAVVLTLLPIASLQANDSWYTQSDIDEMTGDEYHYAFSPKTNTTRKLPFPHNDLQSWIYVGCHESYKWAAFGFTSEPNIPDDRTKDGYNLIDTRVKWDEEIRYDTFKQQWGSRFIESERNSGVMIERLKRYDQVLLELDWYRHGNIYFRYSLKGSVQAISEIREKCTGVAQPPVEVAESNRFNTHGLKLESSQVTTPAEGEDRSPYRIYDGRSVDLEKGWYVILEKGLSRSASRDFIKNNKKKYEDFFRVKDTGLDTFSVIVGPYRNYKSINNVRQALRKRFSKDESVLNVVRIL